VHECPAPHDDEHAPAHVPGAHRHVPPAPEHAIPDEHSADVQQCPAPTHIEPHACVPLGHAQAPPGVGQVIPAAQSLVAQHDAVPMHIPAQTRIVDGQPHPPWPSHTWPPVHRLTHAPPVQVWHAAALQSVLTVHVAAHAPLVQCGADVGQSPDVRHAMQV